MRLASILAHVLASTTLMSCGGQTIGFSDQPAADGEASSRTSPAPSQTIPTESARPPAPPPPVDAGVDTGTDAGCSPVLVRSDVGCSDVWHQPCGVPADVHPEDGMTDQECAKVCGPQASGFQYWGCSPYLLDDLPGPSFTCHTCVAGRRPDGYADTLFAPTVAEWLARSADLERVSIDAFQILRRELAHHGAPEELLQRAMRAEADEVVHARAIGALAVRAGATLRDTPVRHGPVRSLFDIALENAVEGCVRETYGALVAGFQAERAQRLDVRRLMKRIYRDETAHADLAWSVHVWIMEKLTNEERARVTSAMAQAACDLATSAKTPISPELAMELGLPLSIDALRLVHGLEACLFKPALAA